MWPIPDAPAKRIRLMLTQILIQWRLLLEIGMIAGIIRHSWVIHRFVKSESRLRPFSRRYPLKFTHSTRLGIVLPTSYNIASLLIVKRNLNFQEQGLDNFRHGKCNRMEKENKYNTKMDNSGRYYAEDLFVISIDCSLSHT